MIRTRQKPLLLSPSVDISRCVMRSLGVGSGLRRGRSKALALHDPLNCKAGALLLPRRRLEPTPSKKAFDATPSLIVRIKTLFSHAPLVARQSLYIPLFILFSCRNNKINKGEKGSGGELLRELKRIREAILSWSGQTRHRCSGGQDTVVRSDNTPLSKRTTHPCPNGQRTLVRTDKITSNVKLK
jgi:hypothetical protein